MRFLALVLFTCAAGCASTPELPPVDFADFRNYPEQAILVVHLPPDSVEGFIQTRQFQRVDRDERRFIHEHTDGDPLTAPARTFGRVSGVSAVVGEDYAAVLIAAGDYVVISERAYLLASRGSRGQRRVLTTTLNCFSHGAPLYHIEAGQINVIDLPFTNLIPSNRDRPAPSVQPLIDQIEQRLGESVPVLIAPPLEMVQFEGSQSMLTSGIRCPESSHYTIIGD